VLTILAKNWWSLLIRGLAALALGVVTIVHREITLFQLVLFFFGYALIDGIAALAGAIRAAEARQRWGPLLFEALADIVTAIVAIAWPGVTILGLVYIIAAWALVTGVFEILSALRLRREIPGEWLLALSGAASLVLGALMIALPLAGASAISRWLGAYALFFGALLIALGLRLRSYLDPFIATRMAHSRTSSSHGLLR
jgi:uncharacterized membrane protein HdeD (DUF308 family)